MPERSLRLSPGTPPDEVIAAFNGLADRVDRFVFLQTLRDVADEPADVKAGKTSQAAPAEERLTQADVRQSAQHAVRETRSGIPDATAPWTLILGPGCVVVNDETGNRFPVQGGNAIALDDQVKLRVLDKAEEMIDPDAKVKPVEAFSQFLAVPVTANGDTDWHAVEQLAKLKILEAKAGR